MATSYLEQLTSVINDVIAPQAVHTDATATFPATAIESLGKTGLLGLISAEEIGGQGEGLRAAAAVVRELAASCASTAMIVCMHYAGTAVVEAFGPRPVREAIASGQHLTTLAFSEAGSRSHFWAPVSSATAQGEAKVLLNARKSMVTSAAHADSYIWSSRPLRAEGPSTLWLVPSSAPGLDATARFDGLGLRGNGSSPVTAADVAIEPTAMLGADGKGDEIMLTVVLSHFQIMSAAVSVGIMQAAIDKTIAHVTSARFEHLDSRLADLPTVRAYLARMRLTADQAAALLDDTLSAIEAQRPDATLRVLEVKAAAGEAATTVTELAMRVCGGAAFRKEGGAERHFRDARAATVMAPTSDALYDFIGRALCGIDLFG